MGRKGEKVAEAFDLSCALSFFAARLMLQYKSCDRLREVIDHAVEQVCKYNATMCGEDATAEAREMLLAPFFTEVADKFAKEWIEAEATETTTDSMMRKG